MSQDGMPKKKVRPYPIPVILKTAQGEVQTKIIKVEPLGFYVEDPELFLATGSRVSAKFALPLQEHAIEVDAMLVRNVDSFIKPGTKNEVSRLLEFHFLNLGEIALSKIKKFVIAIGQK